MITKSALLLGLLGLAACSVSTPSHTIQNGMGLRAEAVNPASLSEEEQAAYTAGRVLLVQTTGVVTDGRIAKIRGRVQNLSDKPVEGIRYTVKIVAMNGDPQRVLDTFQEEVDTCVAPSESAAMRLDVESMYFGSAGPVGFQVLATPRRLGGRDVEPPPGWRQ
jgi:hypothetical protein